MECWNAFECGNDLRFGGEEGGENRAMYLLLLPLRIIELGQRVIRFLAYRIVLAVYVFCGQT